MSLEKFSPSPQESWRFPDNNLQPESNIEKAEAEVMSALNKLESLTRLNGDSGVQAMMGSRANQALVNYFEASGNKVNAYNSLKLKLEKFNGSLLHTEELLYGAVGEYQIQNLIENVANNVSPEFKYRHADQETDIDGIDAFITPPQGQAEFINPRTGKLMDLALSIKSAPLPPEINDIFYPCRTQTEFEEGLARIADDYRSLKTNLSRTSIEENIDRITKQMTTAYRRLHGFQWDPSEGEWYKPKDIVPTLEDRSKYIPVIALASSQTFAPIGDYGDGNYFPEELTYTAEFQLADNPDKWARKFYSSDGYLDPNLPYAA